MGKSKKSNKKQKRKKGKKQSSSEDGHKPTKNDGYTSLSNFLPEAGRGCYIARYDVPNDWMIGWEEVDPNHDEFVGVQVPEIAIDMEEQSLSLCNMESFYQIAYITVYETTVRDTNGIVLTNGSTTDNDGNTSSCSTFIVLCPPHVFAHLCYLDMNDGDDITQVRIESDVREWNQHPNPMDEHSYPISFPVKGGPFLCTQSEGGQLTHFFSGNLHAIDFACPIGTPLLAVADGTVIESNDQNTLTGIAVTNLFQWNSIILQIDEITPIDNTEENTTTTTTTTKIYDDTKNHNNCGSNMMDKCEPKEETMMNGNMAQMKKEDKSITTIISTNSLFVEYVHIQKSLVTSGDRVQKGQIIGYSGSVGFSPEPHLHFSAFRSSDPTAPTVRVNFESNDGTLYLPKAGNWYDQNGLFVKKE